MQNLDSASGKRLAKGWMIYEASIVKLDYSPLDVERKLGEFASESLAYLEAHYLLNGCFIDENYILDNADAIKHIDTIIVHGRYDFICMPSAAYELQQAIGDKAKLHFVIAGHSTGDVVQREVVKAYARMLW